MIGEAMKWWLKHGPGGPGGTARQQARLYKKLKAARPSATDKQVLEYMRMTRMAVAEKTGKGDDYRAVFGDYHADLEKFHAEVHTIRDLIIKVITAETSSAVTQKRPLMVT